MTRRTIGSTAPIWRPFLSAVVLASSGVTFGAMSVWAQNFPVISSPLRLLQLIALEVIACMSVLAIVGIRRGNLTPVAMTMSLAGLLFNAGGALSMRFGIVGAVALLVVVTTACAVLTHRVAQTNTRQLQGVALWFSIFLLIQPPLTVALNREAIPSSIVESAPLPTRNTGSAEDFFLVVLDGYASFATLRDEFSHDNQIQAILLEEGFQLVDAAWSASTRSEVAIAGLVNFGVPLDKGNDLAVADSVVLHAMISGDARLFAMFGEAGYTLTYVESGWIGSVCGPAVDVCIRRLFVDEAVRTVADTSLVGHLRGTPWSHASARAGLHTLEETGRLMGELGTNGVNDLVFAHVMLPHGPYVLGSDCMTTGADVLDPADERSVRALGPSLRAAYLEQVGCVNLWIADLAAQAPDNAAVMLTGDHGSLFRGQMLRDVSVWNAADIAERAQTFLASKLPAACGDNSGSSSSLEVLMDVSDCLLDTDLDRANAEKLWLFGNGPLPRCIEKPQGNTAISDIRC